ncbi:MAG: isopropylmalate isomerase, partial [Synechococcaceae cyanobacterium SM2_3_60]|nr:isopropylmalate isomerase [Synechococcaceae cyanobacterium SM2_3_60]
EGAHPFDAPDYQGAEILVVNANFGCGSSREHAPQAIARWGIRAIIGESFAEIFFGNCLAMGIPCATAAPEVVQALQVALAKGRSETIATNPSQTLCLDIASSVVRLGEQTYPVSFKSGPQSMLLNGTWDTCGQLAAQADAVKATAGKLPYMGW